MYIGNINNKKMNNKTIFANSMFISLLHRCCVCIITLLPSPCISRSRGHHQSSDHRLLFTPVMMMVTRHLWTNANTHHTRHRDKKLAVTQLLFRLQILIREGAPHPGLDSVGLHFFIKLQSGWIMLSRLCYCVDTHRLSDKDWII